MPLSELAVLKPNAMASPVITTLNSRFLPLTMAILLE